MRTSKVIAVGVAALAVVAPLLTGCGDDGEGDKKAKASEEPKGPVTLEFWGWAPPYEKAVKAWNASHPNITIKFNKIQPGLAGGYDKMFAAVKGGQAPCLAQIGYESLPNFLSEGALQDVATYAKPQSSKFVPWSWNQVKFGEKVYGVPLDIGPMAMFYRTDVFQQFGLQVPKTWDEFKAAAEKLNKADSSYKLTNFAPGEIYNYAGLVWQAGGRWFTTQGDSWKVGFADPNAAKVTAYWQDLVSRKLVATEAGWTPGLNKKWASGKIATVVGGAWTADLLADVAKSSKGKWAVAPMPQWQAGGNVAGNDGGSSTAVLKGCKYPRQAVEFAAWFANDPASLNVLVPGIYPASLAGQGLPAATAANDFFGGQKIGEVFKAAASTTDGNWRWGPTMVATSKVFGDQAGKFANGKTSLAEALKAVQDKTLAEMKSKGMTATA